MMLVISMVFVGVYCLTDGDAVRVRADGELQFYIDETIKGPDGSTIPYIDDNVTLSISNAGDAEFQWHINNRIIYIIVYTFLECI